jgi:tRNA uracil 4-sulfurtransferase
MHYIARLFPEITIKSPPVRKRLTRQVRDNLRKLLRQVDADIQVERDWEKIDVWVADDKAELFPQIEAVLKSTPGLGKFSRVRTYPLTTLDDILAQVQALWRGRLGGKTFCVRVKRVGLHDFRSVDVERFLGAGLMALGEASGVRLKNPDVLVQVEILNDQVHVVEDSLPGLGGYPLGSQDAVLSLISGGFDSTVASYLCMKRGLMTHYCFFNLGGRAHELGVKEVTHFLWSKFGASHRVKFVTVPFEAVVTEILTKVDNTYMGVVLKRMMMRAATAIAREMKFSALITGESVSQVASQTLTNLAVIDEVTDILCLRPLAVMDKGDIIDIARAIGTEKFAATMPEYCGVISVKPTTRAKLPRVRHAEAAFDIEVLNSAIARRREENVQDMLTDMPEAASTSVEIFAVPQPGAVIVDIRHPDEIVRNKLKAGNAVVVEIPFFELDNAISSLEGGQLYLLYCDRGVMSRLHAEILREKGVQNVGVYRPQNQ